jgi:hypothetical protein
MTEGTEKTLFFIKSPTANVTAIEQFLKKRGFNVVSESYPKVAILKIMETAPDYILISWDHPNERVTHLPKLILQSVKTTIIAYCSSNDKLQIRKLQGSGQPLKLFPPLSGPAIQRLISKLEKEKETSNASNDALSKKSETHKNSATSNMIQVKSGYKNEELDNFMKELQESSDQQGQISSEVYLDKGKRAADLRNFQKGHKSNPHFINPQDTNNLMPENKNFQPTTEIQSGSTLFERQDQYGTDLLQHQTPSSTTSIETPPITHKLPEQTKTRLNLKFDEQVKVPIEEMIETLIESEQNDQFSELKNDTLEKTENGFCIVVEHLSWSGYLIVASEDRIDPSSLEMLLTNWISENLESDPDTSTQLILNCFNIKLYDIPFEKLSSDLADYTRSIMLNSRKTVLSFFAIAPKTLSLKLHELHDMFEVMTSEIPISMPLPFDINLYLPENRKFILYSKPNTVFAAAQLERIREKRVEKLYVNLEYENAIQKFRAENRVRFMAEKYKAQQGK